MISLQEDIIVETQNVDQNRISPLPSCGLHDCNILPFFKALKKSKQKVRFGLFYENDSLDEPKKILSNYISSALRLRPFSVS